MKISLAEHRGKQYARGSIFFGLRAAGLLLVLGVGLEFTVLLSLSGVASATSRSVSSLTGWYLRSGQLRADMRTAVALVSYILSPEPEYDSGELAAPKVAQPALAGSTNPPASRLGV